MGRCGLCKGNEKILFPPRARKEREGAGLSFFRALSFFWLEGEEGSIRKGLDVFFPLMHRFRRLFSRLVGDRIGQVVGKVFFFFFLLFSYTCTVWLATLWIWAGSLASVVGWW